jgi:hypothetical protein
LRRLQGSRITDQHGVTYHVHLTAKEAQQFVEFVDERT